MIEVKGFEDSVLVFTADFPNHDVKDDLGGGDGAITNGAGHSGTTITLESYSYLGLGTIFERDHPENGVKLIYVKRSVKVTTTAAAPMAAISTSAWIVSDESSFQRCVDCSGTATACLIIK